LCSLSSPYEPFNLSLPNQALRRFEVLRLNGQSQRVVFCMYKSDPAASWISRAGGIT
jgi:hypothetical protein